LTAVTVFFLVKTIQFLFVAPVSKPEPLTDSPSIRIAGTRPKIGSYEQYASLRKSNLFGALSSSNVAARKVIEEQLPETTLELELLGCVSSYEPELSFAIIRDKRRRTEGTYAPGDFIVADAKVEEIREWEVVISRAGRREVLAMSFTDESPFRTSSPLSFDTRQSGFQAPVRTSPASDSAVRVVNENLRYINREKVMEEVSNNLGQLVNEFRTSPNVTDNKPAGVSIDAVGSGPLVEQSGIRSGDIVKSVNGVRINSLNDILELKERLQNAPEIRVVIERDGRHRTLVYKIR
jgi:type II secretion system protein C